MTPSRGPMDNQEQQQPIHSMENANLDGSTGERDRVRDAGVLFMSMSWQTQTKQATIKRKGQTVSYKLCLNLMLRIGE